MPQVMRSELNDLHAQTESNTSNIDLKANKTDLESLQSAVNNQSATISTKANQTDLIATNLIVKNLSDRKADISLVNDLLTNVSQGGPADTLDNYNELIAKYPSGSNKPMLVKEPDGITGYIYTWTSGAWKKGVLYQDAGLPEATKKIIETALHGDTIVYTAEPAPEYKDLNALKPNTVVSYAISGGKVLNVPTSFAHTGSFTVATLSPKNDIKQQSIQIFIDKYNRFFYRICWGGYWTTWEMPNKWEAQNKIFAPGALVAPYDNLNTLPVPSTVTYGRKDVLNAPTGLSEYVITTMSGSGNLSGAMQLLVDKNTGHTYVRVGWGPTSNVYFTSWNQLDKEAETLTPQEERYDSPSLSMFGNFGVIGDSFASGSLKVGEEWGGQTDNTTWGAMIARKWGTNMLHLASSGLSTRSWLAHYNGLAKLNASDAQDIYYCVLGINDYWSLGLDYIGTIDDVENGSDTFFGNYGKIIKAIQTRAPKAKIILFSVADPSAVATSFNVAIEALANHFGIPYVDQKTDGLFTSSYYLNNMVGGHPTGPMYASMALAFERLIKKAVVDNFTYFKDYGL